MGKFDRNLQQSFVPLTLHFTINALCILWLWKVYIYILPRRTHKLCDIGLEVGMSIVESTSTWIVGSQNIALVHRMLLFPSCSSSTWIDSFCEMVVFCPSALDRGSILAPCGGVSSTLWVSSNSCNLRTLSCRGPIFYIEYNVPDFGWCTYSYLVTNVCTSRGVPLAISIVARISDYSERWTFS